MSTAFSDFITGNGHKIMTNTTKNITNLRFTLLFAICLFAFAGNAEAKSLEDPKANNASETREALSLKLVRGFVVDEFGEPMVGVEVSALGSHKKTITNTEGKYSLLALESDVVKFTQIGVSDKEEKITSSRIVNVSLIIE